MRAAVTKVATASFALMTCKPHSDGSLTSFFYRWGELLLQSCGITAEQCKDMLKIDLFSSLLFNEMTAR